MKSNEVGQYWEANAAKWTEQSRAGFDVYRDALNTPAFLAMLPTIRGLSGLDIGCGEGTNTRLLAERGGKMTAVDIAPTFISNATETEKQDPYGISYRTADAAALPFPNGSFDFVTAFMSLMDMPDQEQVFREANRVIKANGFIQFSILHPCFVPSKRRTIRNDSGQATGVEINDYFSETNGEIESWWFSTLPEAQRIETEPFRVPRFHRTLSTWVKMICSAGLVIEALEEPRASAETARLYPTVADTTQIAPIFMHIRVRKTLGSEGRLASAQGQTRK
jgi:ubiquinone/menaquinone biosynthesis C-methylase UbiE